MTLFFLPAVSGLPVVHFYSYVVVLPIYIPDARLLNDTFQSLVLDKQRACYNEIKVFNNYIFISLINHVYFVAFWKIKPATFCEDAKLQ